MEGRRRDSPGVFRNSRNVQKRTTKQWGDAFSENDPEEKCAWRATQCEKAAANLRTTHRASKQAIRPNLQCPCLATTRTASDSRNVIESLRLVLQRKVSALGDHWDALAHSWKPSRRGRRVLHAAACGTRPASGSHSTGTRRAEWTPTTLRTCCARAAHAASRSVRRWLCTSERRETRPGPNALQGAAARADATSSR